MSSRQQITVDVDVTASGTRITLMAPTDTGRMGVIYSEFHPMPPAQRQPAPAQDVAGKVIAEHSGCGYGIQVDQLTVRLYRGDKVIMVRGPLGAAHDKQSGENK